MSYNVLCYCYHVSHVLNLGQIPALLAAAGWRVRWLNAFPAESFPAAIEPSIEYAFNVQLPAVGNEEADLYLTPLVGQSMHFPRRAKRVHFLVSLAGLEGVYDERMFDHYDAIACAGRHHIEELAALGRKRGWPSKCLLPVGYPKLDGQRRQLEAWRLAPPDAPLTVVFAPTHAYYVNQQHSALGRHGEKIVTSLIDDGLRVIFRPHIESWRDQDRPVIERIVARFKGNPLFVLDRSGNYFESYAQSHLMLTDISGTGFTYAFTLGRPALFFAPDAESERGKTGIQFAERESVGLVIRSIDDLLPKLHQAQSQIDLFQERISNFRDGLIFNIGNSEAAFVEIADRLPKNCDQPK